MKRNTISEYFLNIKKWMFPTIDEPTSKGEKVTDSNSDLQKYKKTNDKEFKVKMIHQYPKQGAFRFPIIKDSQEDTKKRKKQYEQKQPEVNKKPREKFQGKHFTPQTIPSPVFGFQTREKENNKGEFSNITVVAPDDLDSIEEVNSKQIQSKNIKAKASIEKTDEKVIDQDSDKQVDREKSAIKTYQNNVKKGPKNKVYNRINQINDKDELVYSPEIQATILHGKNKVSIADKQKELPFNVMRTRNSGVKLETNHQKTNTKYLFPPIQLLNEPIIKYNQDQSWLDKKTRDLNETFDFFHILAKVVHVTKGPSVTRFEIHPERGVKVSKIVGLTDDIKLSLAAREIRIEAPIPGKNTVGIEVPNDVAEPVYLRQILDHPSFQKASSPLTVAMGIGISGDPVLIDLQKMPHGLIAGSTGSGKSVCVNSILTSIIYKADPKEVRLLLIDPKVVELAPFNDVPHLAAPVITDPKVATEGLKWAVSEMERRYECFAKAGTRDISRYNEKLKKKGQDDKLLPYLLIVVDELADLMMVSPQDVEGAICRIAQKARACGIHLLVATQRPSVDVITGLIKANISTRIAFSVSSQVDSRTIIDGGGAERLLGKGDMLLLESGSSKPVRIQGSFVSDDEIDRVVEYVKHSEKPGFLFEKDKLTEQLATETEDVLFDEACEFVVEHQSASASLLQRRLRIGYNRAARLIENMEAQGFVSTSRGSKAREVYLTKHDQKEENR